MKKTLLPLALFVFALFATELFYGQKLCEDSKKNISKVDGGLSKLKCSVKSWKDSEEDQSTSTVRQVNIEISSKKRHLLVRRKAIEGRLNLKSNEELVSTSTDELAVEKLAVERRKIADLIPLRVVEESASFSNCRGSESEKRICFKKELALHLRKHFRYPKEAYNVGIEGKIIVQFTIDKQGHVRNIQAKGPVNATVLEDEAVRIISELPKLEPAKQGGVFVNVNTGVVVNFKIDGSKTKEDKSKKMSEAISFTKVEKIPSFKNCPTHSKRNSDCFNESIISHIQNNFKYPDYAAQNNIQGKVWVSFIIDTKGNISEISARGPLNGRVLEEEAARIVSKIPNLNPGTHQGKKVNVRYVMPITFYLD